MARKSPKLPRRTGAKTKAPAAPGRRRIKRTPLRILVALALLIGLGWGGGHWYLRGWAPDRARYPVQGITVSAASGAILWPTAKAAGVDFAYLLATLGADGRDPTFPAYLDGARGAGLRYGAIHRYSLCDDATAQATRFIVTVPRDDAMLPPVVALDLWPGCNAAPDRARLHADLAVFLAQIEAHTGKRALLRVSRAMEAAHDISGGSDRTLWLEGELFRPDYARRPWVMWTASTWRRVPGIEGAVEWDVVRP
jgi:lysozyme